MTRGWSRYVMSALDWLGVREGTGNAARQAAGQRTELLPARPAVKRPFSGQPARPRARATTRASPPIRLFRLGRFVTPVGKEKKQALSSQEHGVSDASTAASAARPALPPPSVYARLLHQSRTRARPGRARYGMRCALASGRESPSGRCVNAPSRAAGKPVRHERSHALERGHAPQRPCRARGSDVRKAADRARATAVAMIPADLLLARRRRLCGCRGGSGRSASGRRGGSSLR